MGEIVKPKINLKALQSIPSRDSESDIPSSLSVDTPITETLVKVPEVSEKIETPMITKISLGGIKKSAQAAKVVESPLVVPSSEKSTLSQIEIKSEENTLEKSTRTSDSVANPALQSEVVTIGENKEQTGTISIAQEKSATFMESGKENMETGTETPAQNNEPVQFQNYESGFKKQSSHVLKKIQNFHYTPKTRKGLVIGLFSLCFGIIGFLMIFFPEKHSLSVYKASILDITGQNSSENTVQSTQDIQTQETPVIPPEMIKTPETENIGIIEENSENRQENIFQDSSEVRQEKKEKLRQHLLKKYSSS